MTTMTKSDPRIMRSNAPLAKKMHDQGARFTVKNKLGSFKDSNGSYVPYPNGYITGPSSLNYQAGCYISVQTPKGWAQRTTVNHTLEEIITWALAEAKKNID
jgi:hypothetical protein